MADQCSFQQLAAVELLTGHNSRLVVSAVARDCGSGGVMQRYGGYLYSGQTVGAKCKCQRLHRVLIITRIVR